MPRKLLPTFAMAASLLIVVGCLHAPMPWSPDGKWLAYAVEVRPIADQVRPGWLFEPANTPPAPSGRPTGYRIWATRADTGVSVLLEDSKWPVTAPGWSPDGRALAFGRVVAEPEGESRFEVVVLDGPNHRRILSSRPLPGAIAEANQLPGQAIVWSSDGRYLAVPQLSPLGLAILRVDSGRQVNAINDAFLPSWSPDATRLAFYLRGTGDTLHCIDSPVGPARMLAEVGQAGQAPAWTRDSSSVIVVARKPALRGADPPGDQAELIKVRVDTGQSVTLKTLAGDGNIGRDRSVEGVSIAIDSEGENLFCSTVVENVPHQITWYRPREDAVYKKFSVIDFTAPMGSLSLSPDGRTLATRVGPIDRISAPALCDLESTEPRGRLLAPDDSSRMEWIATLVASARTILSALPTISGDPAAGPKNRLVRPSLLPVPGEFEVTSEPFYRLRKIGRLGRTLCDRPAEAPPMEPAVAAAFEEARLFFDYLSENYSAALASLERIEARAETPDRRTRLLALRAQIFIARGNVDQAGHTIAYLRGLARKPGRPIEWDGSRYVIPNPDGPPETDWPDYLAWRAAAMKAMLHEGGIEIPANPDSPRARLGLDGDPRLAPAFPVDPFFKDQFQPPFPAPSPARSRGLAAPKSVATSLIDRPSKTVKMMSWAVRAMRFRS